MLSRLHIRHTLREVPEVPKNIRISGAFRTSSIDEVNVELHLLFVKQQSEKTLFTFLIDMASGPPRESITSSWEAPYNCPYYKKSALGKAEAMLRKNLQYLHSGHGTHLACSMPPLMKVLELFIELATKEAVETHDALITCSFTLTKEVLRTVLALLLSSLE